MNKPLKYYMPRFFVVRKDGGPESPVTGYFLLEWSPFLTVGFLHFPKGSRENYHSHAFNTIGWLFKGEIDEQFIDNPTIKYKPSLKPIKVGRNTMHRVLGIAKSSWVFNIRGPWHSEWDEYNEKSNTIIRLGLGRKILNTKQQKV